MATRRTIVWILSTILGAILASGTIMIFNKSLNNLSFGSTLLIFISFSSLAFLWLDYFFKTEYLRT
jgi:hypothetical protein